ncbi:MAG: Hsp20/alpha crystallin family protein [Spirochaetales bacterium]|nr:Hsp20/alpha crystallin family protein [Spirochaetales bacterium]
MKDRIVIDLGRMMDEIFEATKDFSHAFQDGFNFGHKDRDRNARPFAEGMDYYPTYSYPPVNVYLTEKKQLVLEFALAGFEEKDISLEFQGDYLVFSAKAPEEQPEDERIRYFKKRLKLKDIRDQHYYAPEDKFNREQVKAVFKNGILKVTIPPNQEYETKDGIKVEIIKEDEE